MSMSFCLARGIGACVRRVRVYCISRSPDAPSARIVPDTIAYGGTGGDQRREPQRLVIFGHDPLESEGISGCQWQAGIEHETVSRSARAAASQDTMPHTGALGIEHLAEER